MRPHQIFTRINFNRVTKLAIPLFCKRGDTWHRILPKPRNPGLLCSHVMDRRLARIRWVKRAILPGFARLLKSRARVEQPIVWPSLWFYLHPHLRGHTKAIELKCCSRSRRRGNCAGYHASPINRGAEGAFFFLRSTAFSPPARASPPPTSPLRPHPAGTPNRHGEASRRRAATCAAPPRRHLRRRAFRYASHFCHRRARAQPAMDEHANLCIR